MAEPREPDTAPEVTLQRDARLTPAIRLPAAIGCQGVAAAVERATAQLAAFDEDPVRIGCGPLLEGLGLPTIEVLARLILATRRRHRRVRLEDSPATFLELIDLCGLMELLADGLAAGVVNPRGAPAGRTTGRSGRCRGRT